MLKRILRELITLVPMVYRNIYVYDQIFEISLVKLRDFWVCWRNLFLNLISWAWILWRILRELFTLFPIVYRNIYVYDQIFEISLVKLRDFLGNLTIIILKSTRLGIDFKTNSKRTLNAFSNGIYKMVFLRPDFWETFVKVDQKLVSLPIFIGQFAHTIQIWNLILKQILRELFTLF